MKKGILFIILLFSSCVSFAAEIYVSKAGDDLNKGTRKSPLFSINAAAAKAVPGDVIIVRKGIYRECVRPTIGGTGESKRITYMAAPGELVVIKGSDVVTNWEPTTTVSVVL